jgi:hypothetical protein
MSEAWEQVSMQQRLTELLDILKEQKEKDVKHEDRELAQNKLSADRDIQLTELIEILTKKMLSMEKRVEELEKKVH